MERIIPSWQSPFYSPFASCFAPLRPRPRRAAQTPASRHPAGWLNRYVWGNYSEVGDQGDHLNKYVLGVELERRLRQRSADLLPGISASLSGLYFQVDSKTVWSGYQNFEDSRAFTRYFSEYGLGGGTQYEALAGLELSWKPLSLEVRAGLRHKEFEEYLGKTSQRQDAPKVMGRLTLHDLRAAN